MRKIKILLIICMLTLSACSSLNEVDDASAPRYGIYTEDRYNALIGKQQFTVFFYASWDPNSLEIDKGLNGGISYFPKNTVILRANYDEEFGLKKMYGVTSQSSFVIIDKDGKLKEKLAGPTSEILKSKLK